MAKKEKIPSFRKYIVLYTMIVLILLVSIIFVSLIFSNLITKLLFDQQLNKIPNTVIAHMTHEDSTSKNFEKYSDPEVIDSFNHIAEETSFIPGVLSLSFFDSSRRLLWTNSPVLSVMDSSGKEYSVSGTAMVGKVFTFPALEDVLHTGQVLVIEDRPFLNIFGVERMARIYIPVKLELSGRAFIVEVSFDNTALLKDIVRLKTYLISFTIFVSLLIVLSLLWIFNRFQKKLVVQANKIDSYSKDLRKAYGVNQTELENLQSRLKSISASAKDGIIMVNGNSELTFCNSAIQKMVGYTEKEMIGQKITNFVELNSFESALSPAAFKKMKRTGKGILINRTVEMQVRRKNKSLFPAEVSISSTRLVNGEWEAVATIRDISDRQARQIELIKERNRAEQYFEIAPVIMLVLDREGKIVRINNAGAEILGEKKDDLIGRNWFNNYIPKELRQQIRIVHSKSSDNLNDHIDTFENEIINIKGERRLIKWSNSKVLDSVGDVVATLSAGRDISKLKMAEEKLKASEQEYSDLYNNAPAMFISTDIKTEKIDKVNATFLKKTGYKESEVIGKRTITLYDLGSRAEAEAAYIEFFKTGKIVNKELVMRKKDGDKIFINLNVVAEKDDKGNFVRSREVLTDITQLKVAQSKISRVARLPEVNPFMVLEIGLDGVVSYYNEAAGKKINAGLPLITKTNNLNKIIWDEIQSEPARQREEFMVNVADFVLEVFFVKEKDRFLLYLRDRTEQTKVEEKVKDLDKLKSRFITALSHTARTPLTEVRWALESLVGNEFGELTDAQEAMLHKALSSEQEVISMIDKMDYVLDIERETMNLDKTATLIGSLLRSVLTEYSPDCKSHDVICEIKGIDDSLEVNIDPEKIRRVLGILLDNAIHYTKEGKVSAKISVIKETLTISITDTGIGIPAAEQSSIFDRFFRASNAYSVHPNGLGLGLYIAKAIVEKHGGSIGFKSQEAKGSEFWVKLPLK